MIPLSVPNIAGNEWKYVKECLDTGWISSVGAYVNQFEEIVAQFTGAKYAVAAMNGTAAIHLALQIAGVKPGDEVIVPNITFIASCNAVSYTGAKPLLIDVHSDTWQMDLDLLEEFLHKNTYLVESGNGNESIIQSYSALTNRPISAILPVHVLGNMCDMNRLMRIAAEYHIPVIEDSTEALGSYFEGRHAGTFGMFGTFSFNGNKIISTGGGGMIVTNNEALAKKAKHLTTQAKSDPFEYIHDEIGYNYRLVNILAAVGVAQMEQLPDFLQRKKVMDQRYRIALEGHLDFRFQVNGAGVSPNNWLHTMQTRHQKGVLQHLLKHDIQCRPFWRPMNQLHMFEHCRYISNEDKANHIYQTCLSIPSSTNLTDEQQDIVIQTLLAYQPQ